MDASLSTPLLHALVLESQFRPQSDQSQTLRAGVLPSARLPFGFPHRLARATTPMVAPAGMVIQLLRPTRSMAKVDCVS